MDILIFGMCVFVFIGFIFVCVGSAGNDLLLVLIGALMVGFGIWFITASITRNGKPTTEFDAKHYVGVVARVTDDNVLVTIELAVIKNGEGTEDETKEKELKLVTIPRGTIDDTSDEVKKGNIVVVDKNKHGKVVIKKQP